MNELITARPCIDLRLQFLTTVSALTLLTAVATTAKAEDSDHPTVWIELGGQLEHIDQSPRFTPDFLQQSIRDGFSALYAAQQSPRYSNGLEGSIEIEPHDSLWSVEASIRYSRSNGAKKAHQEKSIPPQPLPSFFGTSFGGPLLVKMPADYADARTRYKESETILDFTAGRDVGIGLFGSASRSHADFGVRFAQFSSSSTVGLHARPDGHFVQFPFGFVTQPGKYEPEPFFHVYRADYSSSREFSGIGPSLDWKSSEALFNHDDTGVFLDWGVNAAVLFGRQKAKVASQLSSTYNYAEKAYFLSGQVVFATKVMTAHARSPSTRISSRQIAVPNVGGFAAISVKYPNAKLTLGYRADFFFGAMDGGLDARRTEDQKFYGPFATISIGLGG
jgi:hypothetical protein